MHKKQDEIRITVRFPAQLVEGLRYRARRDNRSLNGEIVHAIVEFLAGRAEYEAMVRDRAKEKGES